MGRNNGIGILILLVLVIFAPLYLSNDYYIRIYTNIGLNCIIVIGLSLFMGYAGQISLGHAGFYAIGAYTSGFLAAKAGISPVWTIFIGMGVAGAVAILIGIPSLKLRGHYLAMATLGFGFIIYSVFKNAIKTSDGIPGIAGIPQLSLFGFELESRLHLFYLTWFTLAVLLTLSLNIMRSRVGRACMAIHGNETAAGAMGINTSQKKIQIFIISAIFASIAGSFRAFSDPYLGPGSFSVDSSIHLVILVSIGGMTNLWTALSGAIFLSLLFTNLNDNWDFFKEYKILFDGAILMLIMMFFPKGLFIGIGEKFRKLPKILSTLKRKPLQEGGAK